MLGKSLAALFPVSFLSSESFAGIIRAPFAAPLLAELELMSQSGHAGTSVLSQCFEHGV
jgi:hypothetical protein